MQAILHIWKTEIRIQIRRRESPVTVVVASSESDQRLVADILKYL